MALIPEEWRPFVTVSESGCWVWTGGHHSAGYGKWRGRTLHRLSYEKFVGPIPPGHEVCHSCDNPPCCNPEHLWAGTHADNMRDMFAKGRANRANGESHTSARLTVGQVREIRSRAGTESLRSLSKVFGVSHQSLSDIVRGKTWKGVV